MEAVKRTVKLMHKFDEHELNEYGSKIADLQIEIKNLEAEKAAIAKKYGDNIKGKRAESVALSEIFKAGGEERLTECEVKYNHPTDGKKEIVRTDTGEVWIEDMTEDDYDLFMNADQKDEAPEEETENYELELDNEVTEETTEEEPEDETVELTREEMEADVLGYMLFDGNKAKDVVEILNGYEFVDEKHQRIYDIILSIIESGKKVDTGSVYTLATQNNHDIGGAVFISKMKDRATQLDGIEDHLAELAQFIEPEETNIFEATYGINPGEWTNDYFIANTPEAITEVGFDEKLFPKIENFLIIGGEDKQLTEKKIHKAGLKFLRAEDKEEDFLYYCLPPLKVEVEE